jgi:hypothetical protein
VAELPNPQEEQFARLLAVGVAQAKAYGRCGWKEDKANASKRAAQPHIVQRVQELRMEEAERQAKLRTEAGTLEGVDELKKALAGAAAAGQWSACVSAAKELAALDGSGDKLSGEREPSVEEILASIDRHGDPLASLMIRMIAPKTSFEPRIPPDGDLNLAVDGLAQWFTSDQLHELGRRLSARR